MRPRVISRAIRRCIREIGAEFAVSAHLTQSFLLGFAGGCGFIVAVGVLHVMPAYRASARQQAELRAEARTQRQIDDASDRAYLRGIIDMHEGRVEVVESQQATRYRVVHPDGEVEAIDRDRGTIDPVKAEEAIPSAAARPAQHAWESRAR